MPQLSDHPTEKTRKLRSVVLQAVQRDGKQHAIAAAMGVSDSTISRLVNDHLDNFAAMLAHAGLKVVPVEHTCVSPETYQFLTATHARVMRTAPQLIWDSEE
jgi:predicted XRE-type DNA-binding protein